LDIDFSAPAGAVVCPPGRSAGGAVVDDDGDAVARSTSAERRATA
jgi:hypothetical protein